MRSKLISELLLFLFDSTASHRCKIPSYITQKLIWAEQKMGVLQAARQKLLIYTYSIDFSSHAVYDFTGI